jgi:ketosteroid isomerase-like protein
MSNDSIEVVKRAFNAFRRGDPRDAIACLTEDVEWHNTATFPGPRKVVGREAVVAFCADAMEPWSAEEERIEEIRTSGEGCVVVSVHSRGRGRSSGIPIDERWAMTFTLRAGKITRVDVRGSFAKALEVAGLSG